MEHKLEFASILSARTKEGAVEMSVLDADKHEVVKVQFDVRKARELLDMLAGAIEAAVSDQIFFALLTKNLGLPEAAAARALIDLRELRQGSRKSVYPT